MDAHRSWRGRWGRRAAAAVVILVAGSVPAANSEDTSGECRIIGGSASLLADQPLADGSFAFRGIVTIVTRACGDGPKGVTATFTPIAGAATTCAPVPTPRIDEGACAVGSVGVGLAGTPVVVSATAYTSGVANEHLHDRDTLQEFQDARIQPGAEERTSQCVVLVPEDGGRFGCSLF